MSRGVTLAILVLAASLEAGGDALMRSGLHATGWGGRLGLFSCAALVLFLYGWTVNAPPWSFGRLLGLYVVFFFLIAQLVAWLFFKEAPSLALMLGGSLIVAGGLVIALGRA